MKSSGNSQVGQGQASGEGGLTCGQRTRAGLFCWENVQNSRAFPGRTEHGGCRGPKKAWGNCLLLLHGYHFPPAAPIPTSPYLVGKPTLLTVLKALPHSLNMDPEPRSATTGHLPPGMHRPAPGDIHPRSRQRAAGPHPGHHHNPSRSHAGISGASSKHSQLWLASGHQAFI